MCVTKMNLHAQGCLNFGRPFHNFLLEFVCLSFFNECANAEEPVDIVNTVKRFMYAVGNVLDWELDVSDYECELNKDDRSDANLLSERRLLLQMFVNCMYTNTRNMTKKPAV